MNTKRKVRKKINKKLIIIFDIDDTLLRVFFEDDLYYIIQKTKSRNL